VALGQKQPTLALGNLIGSSVANVLASFSLGLLFMGSATFDRSSKIYATVLLIATSVFLVFLCTLRGTVKRIAGGLLLVAFAVYVASVASLIYKGTLAAPEDDSDDSDEDSDSDSDSADDCEKGDGVDGGSAGNHAGGARVFPTPGATSRPLRSLEPTRRPRKPVGGGAAYLPVKGCPRSLGFHLVRLALGLCALLIASYIVAHSAASLGEALGLSQTVVGTTILSLATTLPEKFVALMAGIRKQPGIMIANTVGSNIFLVTLCGGLLFMGGDAEQIDVGFTAFEAVVMWMAAVVVLAIVLVGGKGWMGGLSLGLYVAFLVVELALGRKLDVD